MAKASFGLLVYRKYAVISILNENVEYIYFTYTFLYVANMQLYPFRMSMLNRFISHILSFID